MFCNVDPDLPKIPENLIDPLDKIELMVNAFPDKDYAHTYASYVVPSKLVEYLQPYFSYPIMVRYQVIKKDLEVHTDIGSDDYKLNYLLDLGGNEVVTKWWDNDEVVHQQLLETNTWYSLNVKVPHNVENVTSPRVSIVVRPLG